MRKRRLVFCGLLLAVGVGSGFSFREPPEIARARPVQLGMTPEEVRAIIGPTWSYRSSNGSGFMAGKTTEWRCRLSLMLNSWTGKWIIHHPGYDDWPVHIHFDSRGKRVDRIKRGSEIVGQYAWATPSMR